MIKILFNYCHPGFFNNFLRIPDCEFYHLVDQDTKRMDVSGLKNVTVPEALDLHPDLFVESWHSLLIKRRRLFRNIPMIFIEHTAPRDHGHVIIWGRIKKDNSKKIIYITHSSVEEWGEVESCKHIVIPHAIDFENYKPWDGSEGFVMSVVNEFRQRDWCCGQSLWKEVTKDFKDVRLYGNGNELIPRSQGPRHKEDLVDLYKSCGVFLNTSLKSPLPMVVLEAASSGCPIVTTNTCELGRIFHNGFDAFVSDPTNIEQMKRDVDILLTHKDKAKEIGINARKMVEENFRLELFIERWKKVLEDIVR